jgi:hypothetical protein
MFPPPSAAAEGTKGEERGVGVYFCLPRQYRNDLERNVIGNDMQSVLNLIPSHYIAIKTYK